MNKLARSIIVALLLIALFIRPSGRQGANLESQAATRRALVGAYDSGQINGIVFIPNEQTAFGLRVLIYRPGFAVEDAAPSYEYGHCAPDGSFAQLSWRSGFDDKMPVTLQWSRVSDNVVVGRVSAPSNTRIAIETYRPWSDLRGDLGWTAFSAQGDRRTIFGERVNTQKTKPPMRNFLLRADRAATGAADYNDAPAMRRALIREGQAQQPGPRIEDRDVSRFAMLSFDSSQSPPPTNSAVGPSGSQAVNPTGNSPNTANSIGFVAMIGDDFSQMEAESNQLMQKPVAEILRQEEGRYESNRVMSGGALWSTFTILNRLVNWNRIYEPEKQLEFLAVNRRNDRDMRKTPLSWDTFFTATVSSMIDDASAAATVKLLLERQAPDGRMPLRRYLQNQRRDEATATAGRSMLPVGALCVCKI